MKDQINGSILKCQYLEAFFLQSAYIEALIKLRIDVEYYLWFHPNRNKETLEQNKDTAEQSKKIVVFYNHIEKILEKDRLHNLINLLKGAEVVDEDCHKLLCGYIDKRNHIFHHLLDAIKQENFDRELKDACNDGEKILKNDSFMQMEALTDSIEQRIFEEKEKIKSSKLKLISN